MLLPLHEIEKLKGVRLSPREQEILQLLCQRWRFQETARQLSVEEASVQRYQRDIRASLKEPLEPETVSALEVSVLAYLAGFFHRWPIGEMVVSVAQVVYNQGHE